LTVIFPLVATHAFTPLSRTKWLEPPSSIDLKLVYVPGLATVTSTVQFLYFVDERELVKELRSAPLEEATQELFGPSFNVPFIAPVTTKELLGELDADTPPADRRTEADTSEPNAIP
jgi:hypothetical protein